MTLGVNEEVRNRIRVAVAAYAYEIENDPIMSDAEFDDLCSRVDPDQDTGKPVLDLFFLMDFSPETGKWVHNHPELDGLRRIYEEVFKDRHIKELI